METLDFNPTFRSEYGWQMSLPLGWERLEEIGSHSFGKKPRPVVFSSPKDNWALSLTWMTSALAPVDEWWSRFSVLIMLPGAVDRETTQALLDPVFPFLGKVVEANSILLPDGNHALEIIEAIKDEHSQSVSRYGYQLVMPLYGDKKGEVFVQRLVFYADKDRFMREIEGVKASARSLSYSG